MTVIGGIVLWGFVTCGASTPRSIRDDSSSLLQEHRIAQLTGDTRSATPEALSALKRDVTSAFTQGRYDRVVRLLEQTPGGQQAPPELLKLGVRSYLQLGQPEGALTLYGRLVPAERPEVALLLEDIALGFLTSGVRHREEYVRLAAYTALADLNRRDIIPVLEDGLLDPSIPVRARAADALGRVSANAGSQGLARALDDPAASVRIAALNALGEGHRGLREKVERIARAEDGTVHVFALAALVRLGKRQALDDIINATAEPDSNTRMAAVGALGRLKPPSAVTVLSQSIYDPDPSVRAFAAGALGELGDSAGSTALTQALSDESAQVRSVAAASLGRLGLPHTRSLLWQAARDPAEAVRAGALEGLVRLRDGEAMLVAGDLVKRPDPAVRSAAAQAMGVPGNQRALPLLAELLRDPQPQPRLTAARALGKIGAPEAIPLMKRGLQDTEPAVRMAAAGALAHVLSKR